MNNEAKNFNNNKKIMPINYNNGSVYNHFFWMTMSKISYLFVSPFTLYSMMNMNILPNIVYSLIIDSGKELLVIASLEFAFMAFPLIIYNTSIIESGRIFYGIIFCNIIIKFFNTLSKFIIIIFFYYFTVPQNIIDYYQTIFI